MLAFKEIVKKVKGIKISEYHEKIWVKKPGFFESKDAGRWVAGYYFHLDNNIKIYSAPSDEAKISTLIHELIHAARWHGFDRSQRKLFLDDMKWWRRKNKLIDECREEMIAYIGQYTLSKRIGLDKTLTNAENMYQDYKARLEKAKGSKCLQEELDMLCKMAADRIIKVNNHYYNFDNLELKSSIIA